MLASTNISLTVVKLGERLSWSTTVQCHIIQATDSPVKYSGCSFILQLLQFLQNEFPRIIRRHYSQSCQKSLQSVSTNYQEMKRLRTCTSTYLHYCGILMLLQVFPEFGIVAVQSD